jgi:hypothetical protein
VSVTASEDRAEFLRLYGEANPPGNGNGVTAPLTATAAVQADTDFSAYIAQLSAAVSEGFCIRGHPLVLADVHGDGHLWGSCSRPPSCSGSWRIGSDGQLWGMNCVPGSHACGQVTP